jgi:hypothetical protein
MSELTLILLLHSFGVAFHHILRCIEILPRIIHNHGSLKIEGRESGTHRGAVTRYSLVVSLRLVVCPSHLIDYRIVVNDALLACKIIVIATSVVF